jgi:hypothetical protein
VHACRTGRLVRVSSVVAVVVCLTGAVRGDVNYLESSVTSILPSGSYTGPVAYVPFQSDHSLKMERTTPTTSDDGFMIICKNGFNDGSGDPQNVSTPYTRTHTWSGSTLGTYTLTIENVSGTRSFSVGSYTSWFKTNYKKKTNGTFGTETNAVFQPGSFSVVM